MEMWHCFCDKVDTKGLRYGSLMIMTDQDTFEAKVGWWGLDEVELYSLKISGAMLVLGRVDFGVMLESVPFLTSWFEWNITFSLFRFRGGTYLNFWDTDFPLKHHLGKVAPYSRKSWNVGSETTATWNFQKSGWTTTCRNIGKIWYLMFACQVERVYTQRSTKMTPAERDLRRWQAGKMEHECGWS